MATGTFCVSGAVLNKAGTNVSTTMSSDAGEELEEFINQAESYINVLTRYNFIDNFAGLNADVKKLLEEAASNLAAIYAIQYDMSGYTSRVEAEDMINILWARFKDCIRLLENQEAITYIKGA